MTITLICAIVSVLALVGNVYFFIKSKNRTLEGVTKLVYDLEDGLETASDALYDINEMVLQHDNTIKKLLATEFLNDEIKDA